MLPLATAIPFVALLLAIAALPLAAPRWWQHNRNKAVLVALVSAPILVYLGIGAPQLLAEKAQEYVSFIIVIGSLFVITGGIHIRGSLAGTPLVNTGMLGIGAVLANVVGTTGASVLLIRPLLRANKRRKRVAHIVIFFIFIVANCAGLLTPIGDPPLLLGFFRGVPFFGRCGSGAVAVREWGPARDLQRVGSGGLESRREGAARLATRAKVLTHERLRIEGAWRCSCCLASSSRSWRRGGRRPWGGRGNRTCAS
jgi:hypothetical protein